MSKVYKAMSDDYDPDEALATLEIEWDNDRRGKPTLDDELFRDGFFELADSAHAQPRTPRSTLRDQQPRHATHTPPIDRAHAPPRAFEV
jgi:hypothetical protein